MPDSQLRRYSSANFLTISWSITASLHSRVAIYRVAPRPDRARAGDRITLQHWWTPDGSATRPTAASATRKFVVARPASLGLWTDRHDCGIARSAWLVAGTVLWFASWLHIAVAGWEPSRQWAWSYCVATLPNLLKLVSPHDAGARAMGVGSHNWRFAPAGRPAWHGR